LKEGARSASQRAPDDRRDPESQGYAKKDRGCPTCRRPDSVIDRCQHEEGECQLKARPILLFVVFPGLLIVIVSALKIRHPSASWVHTGQIQIQPLGSSLQADLGIEPLEPKVRRGKVLQGNGSPSDLPSWRNPAAPSALPCRRRSC